MMSINKPPIGLKPKYVWLEERFEEVKNAIERYEAAELKIPEKWLEEKEWLEDIVYNSKTGKLRRIIKNIEEVFDKWRFFHEEASKCEQKLEQLLKEMKRED